MLLMPAKAIILCMVCIHIQDFIIHHGQQYVIELDANLPPKDLLRVNKIVIFVLAHTVHVHCAYAIYK